MSSLRMTVYVTDSRGNVHRFRPGDEVPGWAAAVIRNPRAWADDASAPSPAPTEPAPPAGESQDHKSGPPPQGGPGSGRALWAAYAEDNGIEVDPEWNRDDIIEACEAEGIEV